jgi:hypothetical protein
MSWVSPVGFCSIRFERVRATSRSQWNGGYGAHSGPSRSDAKRAVARGLAEPGSASRFASSARSPHPVQFDVQVIVSTAETLTFYARAHTISICRDSPECGRQ